MDQHYMVYLWRIVRFLIVLLVTAGLFVALYYVSLYTYPFLIGLGIAFLIHPLVRLLEEKVKLPRTVAVMVTLLFIVASLIGIMTIVVVELINGTTHLATQLPVHFKSLVTYVEQFVTSQILPVYESLTSLLSTLDAKQQSEVLKQVQQIGTNVAESGATILKSILEWIPMQLGKLPEFATVLVFSLLSAFFISKDWERFSQFATKLFPASVIQSTETVFQGLKQALVGFIRAQFTLISITAFIVLLGLVILRVEYAITIAVITGIVDLLPYLGTGLIFIPWMLYMFFTGNYFMTIGLAILYIIVIVQRQMMEPKVLSSNIGIDPLATLLALFVGYKLIGFLGLLVGPVVLVFINTLHQAKLFEKLWTFIYGSSNQ
ncbi:membrane protein [Pontibacillus halophilus JSM 076056 = DSM 19796]|uniref:Membrane protein n=2 Tax=Pontibacillus TaxID=289201 RepID=A0A0A5GQD2_9BACI|nr:membrane protein [Pontibacillus halophilus JSM 076056 = DSM 19796]